MSGNGSGHKAWAGRMGEATHPLVDAFTTSFPVDRRLYGFDIEGSIAHCGMLGRCSIIPKKEAHRIIAGLHAVKLEFDEGRFVFRDGDEDVHMAIERRLLETIGPVAGKLHTARSRNDQVALDVRLYIRHMLSEVDHRVRQLVAALARLGMDHADAIMPGYTHLQQAQPVLFAHHLLAYGEMLQRDSGRLADCRRRANILPLGSGALAGTTFPIDRADVARALGFPKVSQNSLDAVSDRDFIAEFLAAGAILGMHLSRLAEELVLWSSLEFQFVEFPDAFATGSSMMPQKKNPDVAELVRGKTGRLYGNLIAILTTLKGLPLAYNRDLQEDKEPLFDTADTLLSSLEILAELLPRLIVNEDRMRRAATAGHTLATELADYLATRGMPFRDAHAVVGAIVRQAIGTERDLSDFTTEEFRAFSPLFADDVHDWLTLEAAVRRRRAPGGTAPANVNRRLRRLLPEVPPAGTAKPARKRTRRKR